MTNYYDDLDDDWDDDEDYYNNEDFDAEDEFSCDNCGPWCEHWGGDGLCMLAIEQQAREHEEYAENYVKENQTCPICSKRFTRYEVHVDELWVWPGDFYNPMVAIGIFGILPTPKGEIHHDHNLYHVWVGGGEYREEKLILLSGELPPNHGLEPTPTAPVFSQESARIKSE